MSAERVDVAIVGGGLVGASVALGLAATPLRVALIEPAPPAAGAAPGWDERCIAINAASYRILQTLGVWTELARSAEPILSTHVSERGRFGVARFSAAEAGLEALGYNLPVRALAAALWQRAVEAPGCMPCAARGVTAIDAQADGVCLQLDDGRVLRASLVIAADGAESPLRAQLGVGARRRDYAQSAIVTAVRCSRPHRGCAYERFTPDGPIALLPKPWQAEAQLCSLIWTTPQAQVEARLAADDESFLAAAQDCFGERLGRLTAVGRRQAWPLFQVLSDELHAGRVVFAGNAAQSLHPVAAQGFNLGLRDAATLAEVLAIADDPGAPQTLARYAALRSRDRRRAADFTDALVRLFSNQVPGLRSLRHLGLLALELAPPVREAVLWQNLGYGGHTPAAARQRP